MASTPFHRSVYLMTLYYNVPPLRLRRAVLVWITAALMLAQTLGAFSPKLSADSRPVPLAGRVVSVRRALVDPLDSSLMLTKKNSRLGTSRRSILRSSLILTAACDSSAAPVSPSVVSPPPPMPASPRSVSPSLQQQQQQQQLVSADQPLGTATHSRLPVVVALTRERGCNRDLLDHLAPRVTCVEIPCIEFGVGPDLVRFRQTDLCAFDLAVITSPRSAQVFASVLNRKQAPDIKIAVVGSGTRKVLENAGVRVDFEPSDMTAAQLIEELPESLGKRILYPASAIAPRDVEDGLAARGFAVTRMNVYTTLPAAWTDADRLRAARAVIVGLASPSAARVWASRAGVGYVAACIGPSTLKEAQRLGFRSCVSPEASRGADGLAQTILDAALTVAQESKAKAKCL